MDSRPLPPGFISQYDQNTQRYFYVDTNTGISQWNHPLDVKPPSPPSVEQTSSQYPQFPSSSPNPNPQGHYPLGFTDPFPSSGYSDQRPPSSALPQPSNYPPTTYGREDRMPESATNPYAMMQQQPSSPYPQPPGPPQPMMQQQSSSTYPQPGTPQPMTQQSSSPYPQPPGPPQPTPFNYPPSYPQSGPGHYGGERPTETQPYSIEPDHRTGNKPHGEAQSYGDKGMVDKVGKLLLGAGVGAAGGLLVGELAKKKHKHYKHKKHKGWKGKGWKGKGWKGKGWKGKGWKGWK